MKRKQAGFTLVELSVAIMALGVAGLAITSLYLGIQQIQIGSAYKESATRAAQRQVEELRNRNYNSLTPGTDIVFSDSLPEALPASSTGVVEVSEPSPGVRRIDVRVVYPHNGSDRSVELSSLIGVIGITQ